MVLPETINDKKTAIALFKAGAFGNSIRQWDSFEEIIASPYRGLTAMRQRGRAGGGFCRYNVPYERWAEEVTLAAQVGINPKEIYFNEMLNDDTVTMQGEYVVTPWGQRWLYYSLEPLPMRQALAKSYNHLEGLEALRLIRSKMCANSWEDLNDVLNRWPGHAIEFTCCSVNVGMTPRRNTIIWEVRNY